jgi:hypothetical protein
MALQYSTALRNNQLDQIEATIGVTPILRIRSGAVPASCAAADTGTVLSTVNLPSDWMAAASGGSKAKSGTWQDASADATGTAAHFRIYDSGGTVCHMQGTVGTSGADLIVDNVSFSTGQSFTISNFTISADNA